MVDESQSPHLDVRPQHGRADNPLRHSDCYATAAFIERPWKLVRCLRAAGRGEYDVDDYSVHEVEVPVDILPGAWDLNCRQ